MNAHGDLGKDHDPAHEKNLTSQPRSKDHRRSQRRSAHLARWRSRVASSPYSQAPEQVAYLLVAPEPANLFSQMIGRRCEKSSVVLARQPRLSDSPRAPLFLPALRDPPTDRFSPRPWTPLQAKPHPFVPNGSDHQSLRFGAPDSHCLGEAAGVRYTNQPPARHRVPRSFLDDASTARGQAGRP